MVLLLLLLLLLGVLGAREGGRGDGFREERRRECVWLCCVCVRVVVEVVW